MVTINLMGGLGNQLFQYSFGRGLGVPVQFNKASFDRDPARLYMLDRFQTHVTLGEAKGHVIEEESLKYSGKYRNLAHALPGTPITFNGYWQNEKYFKHLEDEIRSELTLSRPISPATAEMAEKIGAAENSCFVHIRRTDNLSNRAKGFHGLLLDRHYVDAMLHLYVLGLRPTFFFFSDDPQWCKNKISATHTIVDINPMSGICDSQGNITKHTQGREHEDLYLMSLCRHAIIANSTFSWWGAYLGDKGPFKEDRIVIGPKQWFVSNDVDGSEIMPDRWIRI